MYTINIWVISQSTRGDFLISFHEPIKKVTNLAINRLRSKVTAEEQRILFFPSSPLFTSFFFSPYFSSSSFSPPNRSIGFVRVSPSCDAGVSKRKSMPGRMVNVVQLHNTPGKINDRNAGYHWPGIRAGVHSSSLPPSESPPFCRWLIIYRDESSASLSATRKKRVFLFQDATRVPHKLHGSVGTYESIFFLSNEIAIRIDD